MNIRPAQFASDENANKSFCMGSRTASTDDSQDFEVISIIFNPSN
jgi:hypothetical protein